MLQDLLLLLAAILSGAALRVLYLGASALARATRLAAVRCIFDALWCAAAFLYFAAFTVFLCDGVFMPFALLGLMGGLLAGSLTLGIKGRAPKDGKKP